MGLIKTDLRLVFRLLRSISQANALARKDDRPGVVKYGPAICNVHPKISFQNYIFAV